MIRRGFVTPFDQLLAKYRQVFPRNGSFVLRPPEDIRERVRAEGVPEEAGVYVIKVAESGDVLCVGKAGTLTSAGSFKTQLLAGRIAKGKRNKQPGWCFFQDRLRDLGVSGLEFEWFVTFDGRNRIVPAKAEADLMQAFFDSYQRLPLWNKEF